MNRLGIEVGDLVRITAPAYDNALAVVRPQSDYCRGSPGFVAVTLDGRERVVRLDLGGGWERVEGEVV